MDKKQALCVFLLCGILVPLRSLEPQRQKIIDTARQFLGVPYVYGAESPDAFDCSGFVRYVYRTAAGITIPRSSRGIWTGGQGLRTAAAQPGDIIVFDTVGGAPSHVAILLDNDTMIHAVSQGPRTGVIISSVRDRYFAPKVLGARSFLTAPAAGVPAAPPQNVQADNIADFVTLIISGGAAVSQDRIPIARNSSLRFAITNASGRDATFEILFYKVDPDPAKHVTISRGRVFIKNNEMTETPVYTFAENGQYRLIIKTNDNRRLIERTWRVVEL